MEQNPVEQKQEKRKNEMLTKEIAKTSEAIRKKYLALKAGKMDTDAVLEHSLQPVIRPLKELIEKTIPIPNPILQETSLESASPLYQQESPVFNATPGYHEETPSASPLHEQQPPMLQAALQYCGLKPSVLNATPRYRGLKRVRTETPLKPTPLKPTSHRLSKRFCSGSERPAEEVWTDEAETNEQNILETTMREIVENPEQHEEAATYLTQNLGPLSQEYLNLFFIDKKKEVDHVYGVYYDKNAMKLGDKNFDVDIEDNIIIDNVKYKGTPGLFELIFKRIPDDTVYTDADKQKYKSILLTTNAHRRNHNAANPLLGNRGYKYKHIIASLLEIQPRTGRGFAQKSILTSTLPENMVVTDNAIDYVHWDDPNELVDRIRLLASSRAAGHTGHDNEIVSIIEELREAGLIIN